MKRFLFFVLAAFLSGSALSQPPIYSDDFESYAVMDYLAIENPTWWTTWDNQPGTPQDAMISGDQASSGTRSVLVANSTDLLLKLGDRTTGVYDLSWKMYIGTPFEGYYNIQHIQATGDWAIQVWFLADGSGVMETGQGNIYFNYPKAVWFPVEHFIDLDNDLIRLVINGNVVHEWQFSSSFSYGYSTNTLGAIDFYPSSYDGEGQPLYYFDDLIFRDHVGPAIPVSGWAVVLSLGLIVLLTVFLWYRRK